MQQATVLPYIKAGAQDLDNTVRIESWYFATAFVESGSDLQVKTLFELSMGNNDGIERESIPVSSRTNFLVECLISCIKTTYIQNLCYEALL